jgi:hypothetical protein
MSSVLTGTLLYLPRGLGGICQVIVSNVVCYLDEQFGSQRSSLRDNCGI